MHSERSKAGVRRLAVFAVPFVTLALLATPAGAQDGQANAKAFAKLAKARLATLKPLPAAMSKELALDFKQRIAQVKADGSGSVAALAGALDTLNSATAALATTVTEAAEALRDDALALGGDITGRDFRAGGRGTWDAFLDGADAVLVRADRLAGKRLELLRKGLEAAAKPAGGADIHLLLREPDRRLHRVVPPASVGVLPPGDGGSLFPRPTQIRVVATIVEGPGEPALVLGVQGFGNRAFDLDVVTTRGTVSERGLSLDEAGTAVHQVALDGSDGGPVRVETNPDPLAGPDDRAGIRRPSIGESSDFKPELKAMAVKAGADFRFFAKFSGEKIVQFRQQAKFPVQQHAQGTFTTFETIQGLYDLHDVGMTAMGSTYRLATDNPVGPAGIAFGSADLPDELIPDDASPCGGGIYQTHVARLNARHGQRTSALGRELDKSIAKVLADAGKQGTAVDVAVRRTPIPFIDGRIVSTAPAPVAQFRVRPQANGALLMVFELDGTPHVSGQMSGFADPDEPAPASSVTSVDGGDVTLPGNAFVNFGGNATRTIPVLSDIPLIGRLFSLDRSAEQPRSLLILTSPSLIGELPD